jgi:phosphoglycolate phosphatase
MTILFWDIDGTLLKTGGAGLQAWEEACLALTGKAFDWGTWKTDGLTDHQIAVSMLERVGAAASPEAVRGLVQHYEAGLATCLPARQGSVMSGVRELLFHLNANRRDVRSMLLTGNTAAGARAKLTYYGLQEFFEGGAFSEDPGPRSDIAVRAMAAARARFPRLSEPVRAFVLGDTPRDIECARAIGVPTIAIASGSYDTRTLLERGAWRAFDALPLPAAFEALIDEPPGAPPLE